MDRGGGESERGVHTMIVDERLLAVDRIVFRFGKNDAWDRRLDLSDNPKPAHIGEIALRFEARAGETYSIQYDSK